MEMRPLLMKIHLEERGKGGCCEVGSEKIVWKKGENPVEALEKYCKKRCVGLLDRLLLMSQMKKELEIMEFQNLRIGKLGEEESTFDGDFNPKRSKSMAKSFHKRVDSDGAKLRPSQLSITKTDNSYSQLSIFSAMPKVLQTTNKSFAVVHHGFQNCKSELQSKNTLIKGRIQKLVNHQCSTNKLKLKNTSSNKFPSELAENIRNRIKYLRCKEIFHQLRPNEKGKINKNTIKFTRLSRWEIDILNPLLQGLKLVNKDLKFKDFFKSIVALSKELPTETFEKLLKIKSDCGEN